MLNIVIVNAFELGIGVETPDVVFSDGSQGTLLIPLQQAGPTGGGDACFVILVDAMIPERTSSYAETSTQRYLQCR